MNMNQHPALGNCYRDPHEASFPERGNRNSSSPQVRNYYVYILGYLGQKGLRQVRSINPINDG